MKKLLGILVLGLLLIYFVALALAPNNAEAKDRVVPKDSTTHLSKDVASLGEVYVSKNQKKYNIMIVSAEDGHHVRDGKNSLRFELRDGDCNPDNKGYDDDGTYFGGDCQTNRERIEIRDNSTFSKGEYWYAWSIYLPKDHQTVYPANLMLGQFHFNSNNPCCALGFNMDNKQYGLFAMNQLLALIVPSQIIKKIPGY